MLRTKEGTAAIKAISFLFLLDQDHFFLVSSAKNWLYCSLMASHWELIRARRRKRGCREARRAAVAARREAMGGVAASWVFLSSTANLKALHRCCMLISRFCCGCGCNCGCGGCEEEEAEVGERRGDGRCRWGGATAVNDLFMPMHGLVLVCLRMPTFFIVCVCVWIKKRRRWPSVW